MGRRKLAGYKFITFKGNHRPFHVHIFKDDKEIGRWNIEDQLPMDNFALSDNLKNALIKMGYMAGEK